MSQESQLQEMQIIFQTNNNAERDRVFCANAIMDILNEEPEIMPGRA